MLKSIHSLYKESLYVNSIQLPVLGINSILFIISHLNLGIMT